MTLTFSGEPAHRCPSRPRTAPTRSVRVVVVMRMAMGATAGRRRRAGRPRRTRFKQADAERTGRDVAAGSRSHSRAAGGHVVGGSSVSKIDAICRPISAELTPCGSVDVSIGVPIGDGAGDIAGHRCRRAADGHAARGGVPDDTANSCDEEVLVRSTDCDRLYAGLNFS
jgi:hypothetical protein